MASNQSQKIIDDEANAGKSTEACLQLLFDELHKIRPGLSQGAQSEDHMRDQLLAAVDGVPECAMCLYNPAPTYEGLCAQLRSSAGVIDSNRKNRSGQFIQDQDEPQPLEHREIGQHLVDRTYESRRGASQSGWRGGSRGGYNNGGQHRGRGG